MSLSSAKYDDTIKEFAPVVPIATNTTKTFLCRHTKDAMRADTFLVS